MRWADPRHGWGVLLLACAAVAASGCKKEQPQASAPVDAGVVAVAAVDAGAPDAGPVAKEVKPLRFSNLVMARDKSFVRVTYTLTNPGTVQGRGDACLTLIDEQGTTIAVERLGGIAVKGGLEDTFEDRVLVSNVKWNQVHTVLPFTTAYRSSCLYGSKQPTSEPLRFLLSGQPAPSDLPAPTPAKASKVEDFEVADVQVRQEGSSDRYSITYTVKNVSDHRATGSGCLRAYVRGEQPALEENVVGDFSLAPGASTTVTDAIYLDDEAHWDEVKVLRLFASPFSCADEESSENPGFEFAKPAEIHAPAAQEEDASEATDDASDEATPDNEAAPGGNATEETAD